MGSPTPPCTREEHVMKQKRFPKFMYLTRMQFQLQAPVSYYMQLLTNAAHTSPLLDATINLAKTIAG